MAKISRAATPVDLLSYDTEDGDPSIFFLFFFFKQKTAYGMPKCWSSDVCSSDLALRQRTSGRHTWNLSADPRNFCRIRLLNIAQRLHAQTGRNFVVRQEKEVGQGGLGELTQEIARAAGGDGHN